MCTGVLLGLKSIHATDSTTREGSVADKTQKQLRHDAILSAYSTIEDLRMVTSFALGQTLDEHSKLTNTSTATFDLLDLAQRTGRTRELLVFIKGERSENPLVAELDVDKVDEAVTP